jgi:hypothetical protein
VQAFTAHVATIPNGKGTALKAIEIWNEPDDIDSGTPGVGWDADLNAFPRYVDYVVEAARYIHAMPWTVKVVAPSCSGKRITSQYGDRMYTLFNQFENTSYWEPSLGYYKNASDYIDVISGHMDCKVETHSEDASDLYRSNVLNYISFYNPRNRNKEQWITEFGWPSSFSEDSQRTRTKNFLIEMTGGGYQWLKSWYFTQGFIYLTESCDSTDNKYRSVYRCSNTTPSFNTDVPKLVTSNYLQTLGFPATQQPGVPRE